MQVVEFTGDSLRFLDAAPAAAPTHGFVWIFLERSALPMHWPALQQAAMQLGGSPLLQLHCQDLENAAHPSGYDFTSVYDLILFRRLATDDELPPATGTHPALAAFRRIQTSAVGFAVFDRLLISVHPPGCATAQQFVQRYLNEVQQGLDATSARMRRPLEPADLTLRLLNGMVDSYLELRRVLTHDLEHWQNELLGNDRRRIDWNALMQARSQLHLLADLCEEQQDAIQEWLDSLREQPLLADMAHPPRAQEHRDMLVARARDVVEHIARVAQHVHRLEQSAETVVQIYFAAQGNRTNDIMRVLTALTAIFLPLNLIAGIFGMNFHSMPLLDWRLGFWLALGAMLLIAVLLSLWFSRKRYLSSPD